jgi:RHS repeat-associated protein
VQQDQSTYNNRDELTSDIVSVNGVQSGSTSYAYDANGALVEQTSSSGSATQYQYDVQNRLAGATISRPGVQIVTAYQYDDTGIRVRSTETVTPSGGSPTVDDRLLLVDNNNPTGFAQIIEEYTPGGVLLASYVYGVEPLAETQGGALSYYLLDGHSGVRLVTNAQGLITDRYRYDAFGQLLSSIGSTVNPILYRGERFDSLLGQYYLRARFYDPQTGRFSARDSYVGIISDPETLQKYAFAFDDPVNHDDPSGFNPFFFGMIGAVASNVVYGKQVEDTLAGDFGVDQVTKFHNIGISRILRRRVPWWDGGRGKPDLVDITKPSPEVGEIKPFNELAAGAVQLGGYLKTLNQYDPAIPKRTWIPGFTTFIPRSWIPLSSIAGAIVYPALGGVITYQVIDLGVVTSIAAIAIYQYLNAELPAEVGSAILTDPAVV